MVSIKSHIEIMVFSTLIMACGNNINEGENIYIAEIEKNPVREISLDLVETEIGDVYTLNVKNSTLLNLSDQEQIPFGSQEYLNFTAEYKGVIAGDKINVFFWNSDFSLMSTMDGLYRMNSNVGRRIHNEMEQAKVIRVSMDNLEGARILLEELSETNAIVLDRLPNRMKWEDFNIRCILVRSISDGPHTLEYFEEFPENLKMDLGLHSDTLFVDAYEVNPRGDSITASVYFSELDSIPSKYSINHVITLEARMTILNINNTQFDSIVSYLKIDDIKRD